MDDITRHRLIDWITNSSWWNGIKNEIYIILIKELGQ